MRKIGKIILIALLVTVITSWITTVAYGHENASATLDATIDEGISVEPAPVAEAPNAHVYRNYIGGINPGNLFYINAADVRQDMAITVSLTNADRLIHCFNYLNLEIGVYFEVTPGQWEKALLPDGQTFPRIYLTMNNGSVSFYLPGANRYKVTLESGSYKSHAGGSDIEDITPDFFLEATSV